MSLNNPALIIGGQPKAGTTSLFQWLSKHPDVEPSRAKEVRFFLDQNYPLPSGPRYDGANEALYQKFFEDVSSTRTLLDSSPDYLYSSNALRIREALPNARLVFIVRDPVERAVSWYKFAAEIGRLEKGMTFETFVDYQLSNSVTEETPIHLRALEQNRINKYLYPFLDVFKDDCLVLDFADLVTDARSTVKRVCEFSGLDPSFFDSFVFLPQNVSTGRRTTRRSRLYFRMRARFYYSFLPSARTSALLRPLGLLVKKFLVRSSALESFDVTSRYDEAIRAHADKS